MNNFNYIFITKAYELRIPDDDYLPEMTFDPLDRIRKLVDTGENSFAFCHNKSF